MPNVQVRDVPDDIHAELTRRAARAGKSLQQFLSEKLTSIATTPVLDEVIETIAARPKGRLSIDEAVSALESARARH